MSVRIKGTNTHTLAWVYATDFYDETETADCDWVDQVSWSSSVGKIGVPASWLDEMGLAGEGVDDDEAAGRDVDGDGVPTDLEWLAGSDPTDGSSYFGIGFEIVDGQPVIKWFPDLEGERQYRVWAKQELTDEEWTDVTNMDRPLDSGFQFYRVSVSLP